MLLFIVIVSSGISSLVVAVLILFFRKVTRMTVKMRKKNMIQSTKRKIKTKKMRMLMMKMAKRVTT